MRQPETVLNLVARQADQADVKLIKKFHQINGEGGLVDDPPGHIERMVEDGQFILVFEDKPGEFRRLVGTGGYESHRYDRGRAGRLHQASESVQLGVVRAVVVERTSRGRQIGAAIAAHLLVQGQVRMGGAAEGFVAAVKGNGNAADVMAKLSLANVEGSDFYAIEVTPGLRPFMSRAMSAPDVQDEQVKFAYFNSMGLPGYALIAAQMMLGGYSTRHFSFRSEALQNLSAQEFSDLKGLAMLNRSTLIKYGLVSSPSAEQQSLYGRYSTLIGRTA